MALILEEKYKILDKSIPRIDAIEKVTGSALFTGDIELPNMLYGKILRSPYPHAKIVRIDTSKAERHPGVKAVVTGREFSFFFGELLGDKPALAIDKVRYVGEPVAAVAAVDERIAEEAVELIDVEYEELPSVLDPMEAMKRDAPIIHEDLENYRKKAFVRPIPGTNVCSHVEYSKGDTEKGFEESDYIFEDTFKIPSVYHAALEPHVTIALVDHSGKITIWTPNDAPYRLQRILAQALGLSPSSIRIITPYMGGAFGGKGVVKLEGIAIALAKKAIGNPVKLELTREEVFTSTATSHSAIVTVKTGVKKDGTLVARYVKGIFDAGAYAERGPTVLVQAGRGAAGPYRIPHVKIEGYLVYTNKVPGDAYRGYGNYQFQFAVESQMDMIAERLGLDPLELRLKNILRDGDINPVGQEVISCGLEECLTKAAKAIGWGKKEGKYVGKGIACGFKNVMTPSMSVVNLILKWDGMLEIHSSLTEQGQGGRHVLAKIAAEELGIPLENVKIFTSDTDITPFDDATVSSRTTFYQGNALLRAIKKVIIQVKELLSTNLGIRSIQWKDGKFLLPDGSEISFLEVVKKVMGYGEQIIVQGRYRPEIKGETFAHYGIFWQYAAHAVEVEVDPETGHIHLRKIVAAHDVGKAIDPEQVKLQIVGGVVQGIGNTIYEEIKLKDGTMLNPNFRDYNIPTALDIPDEIIPIIVEHPHPEGPYGAKGVGEGPLVPIHAAIANAIYDAIGIRFKEFPITPEKMILKH